MHAFAVSRPLLLACAPSRTSSCARRPTACAPVVSSPARATLSSSDAEAPKASAPAMSSPASSSSPAVVQDSTIPDVKAGLSAGDEARIASVRTQMEFWFSASNLRRDWYLRRQMDQDGWLDPSVFLHFNKVKNLNADLADIILACRSSDELEVSSPGAASFGDDAGQTRVRRSPDLPDIREDDDAEISRSFNLRGIPPDSTVDSLLTLFAPLGPISYARIYRSKNFPNGPRALICFPDQETAENAFNKFVSERPEGMKGIYMKRRDQSSSSQTSPQSSAEMEPRPPLLVGHITGLSLELDWKVLYKVLDSVFAERGGEPMRYLMYNATSDHCHITCKDTEDNRKLIGELTETGLQIGNSMTTVRLLEDEEEIKEYWRMATEHQAARKARRAREGFGGGPASSDPMSRHPAGVLIKVNGLAEDATWRQLKLDLGGLGNLVYLNYERGSAFCYARFTNPEETIKVTDALSGPDGRMVCGSPVEASVLEGEEEAEYWVRAEEVQRERRSSRYTPPDASA